MTVSEEEGPQPELAKAEDLIQKRDYRSGRIRAAEAGGREFSERRGWFDLGFVENALGKPEDSIAAYRKSVAAKPNVFESNLNLGLQLAKTGQGDAEKFLRAATQLTPTSHVAEGQARAWLSLAHCWNRLSLRSPSLPTSTPQIFCRKILSRTCRPDFFWRSKTNSPMPSRSTETR